jgi:hypothetical protein
MWNARAADGPAARRTCKGRGSPEAATHTGRSSSRRQPPPGAARRQQWPVTRGARLHTPGQHRGHKWTQPRRQRRPAPRRSRSAPPAPRPARGSHSTGSATWRARPRGGRRPGRGGGSWCGIGICGRATGPAGDQGRGATTVPTVPARYLPASRRARSATGTRVPPRRERRRAEITRAAARRSP